MAAITSPGVRLLSDAGGRRAHRLQVVVELGVEGAEGAVGGVLPAAGGRGDRRVVGTAVVQGADLGVDLGVVRPGLPRPPGSGSSARLARPGRSGPSQACSKATRSHGRSGSGSRWTWRRWPRSGPEPQSSPRRSCPSWSAATAAPICCGATRPDDQAGEQQDRGGQHPDVDPATEAAREPDVGEHGGDQSEQRDADEDVAESQVHAPVGPLRRSCSPAVSRMGRASERSSALAVRRYWAPTGRPCRLLARACSIVAAYAVSCWLRAERAAVSAGCAWPPRRSARADSEIAAS